MLSLIVMTCGVGYLLGSVPAGLVVGRLGYGVDIRDQGSGNLGTANAVRVLGWWPGLAVLILDAGKGFLAAWMGSLMRIDPLGRDVGTPALLVGLCAVIGHVAPLFAGFRGGKGVATFAGVLLAVSPLAFVCFGLVFGAVVLVTRIVSLGSIVAAATLPAVLLLLRWISPRPPPAGLLGLSLVAALLLLVLHRGNLARLLAGNEPRLGGAGRRERLAGRSRDRP